MQNLEWKWHENKYNLGADLLLPLADILLKGGLEKWQAAEFQADTFLNSIQFPPWARLKTLQTFDAKIWN